MVSQLYTAKSFYKLQDERKVAKNMSLSKKLRLDSKGYYLNKKTSKGEVYRQNVSANAKVYARSSKQGVTMYSAKRDIGKTDVEHFREGTKVHNKHAHMSDRKSLSSNRLYKR